MCHGVRSGTSDLLSYSIFSSLFCNHLMQDICNRIGLDMISHVLPYLLDDDESEQIETGDDGGSTSIEIYTHEDFVRGAEECLLIEDEMNRLEKEDPEYLAQLEREALEDDPDIVAEIVADVLKQDDTLLKEIASQLMSDVPELMNEMNVMLGEGEKLEDRPDVVALLVAQLLSDEHNLDILDEFDEALSDHYFLEDDLGDDAESIGTDVRGEEDAERIISIGEDEL